MYNMCVCECMQFSLQCLVVFTYIFTILMIIYLSISKEAFLWEYCLRFNTIIRTVYTFFNLYTNSTVKLQPIIYTFINVGTLKMELLKKYCEQYEIYTKFIGLY